MPPASTPGTDHAPAALPSSAPGGATIWLTGLPSAGKTTVALAAAELLRADGRAVEVLDGDEIRAFLSADLGFSREDRGKQVARVGWIARLLARNGVLAFAPLVSPYAADRDALKAGSKAEGLAFLEVYAAAPVEVCAHRDVKGLYAGQRTGAVSGLTGVDAPYEIPTAPDLVLRTHEESVAASASRLVGLLAERGLA
ncbi:adenylyl-sulfate kinase [Cryptosporangium aurantiacum]|uniref:Adenylyl-sulfate kinase n=1 Tax=Cryptosporangium aurantiacum TaxID=134849 RepID=A0A1M7RNT5_9ACTN|nr:adenylyl-sulfate kinase [Cryptosporangium aurantiacum]SHN48007.1 adenylylsulfate kinase [Cryptosporangium aurantiacum]